jgi:hypothetical protein
MALKIFFHPSVVRIVVGINKHNKEKGLAIYS